MSRRPRTFTTAWTGATDHSPDEPCRCSAMQVAALSWSARLVRVAALAVLLSAHPGAAQDQQNEELLRRIDALEQALEQQAREIQELRRLLSERAPQAPAPAAPASASSPL